MTASDVPGSGGSQPVTDSSLHTVETRSTRDGGGRRDAPDGADGTRADASGVDGARLGRELSDAVVMFHEAIGRRRGLSAGDHKALGIITRSGPLTPSELAQLTGLTPGAATGMVDRLVRAGCVRRDPDPHDRRRFLISAVTEPPDDPLLADVFATLGSQMAAAFSRYDERQVAAVVDWITTTIDLLRSQTRRLGGGD